MDTLITKNHPLQSLALNSSFVGKDILLQKSLKLLRLVVTLQ